MDAVLDLDAALLQQVGQLAHVVLRLGHGQAVAGHDHHPPGIGEHGRRVLGRNLAHRDVRREAAVSPGPGRSHFDLAEGAEQHIGERPVHGLAHEPGEDRARGADQRAADDEQVVLKNEACRGDGKAARKRKAS